MQLLAKIGYSQIPEAINSIDKLNFEKKHYRDKYDFIERDYGLFMLNNMKSKETRDQFLNVYNTHTEKELYQFYLNEAGVDYKNKDGSLNYDKIFEILKFNIVTPFTGSNIIENEIGSIIKLLEIELKTTLGYSDKLCNSGGIYICPPTDRAWEWQRFLKEKNLLKVEHSDIVSFNYGYYVDKVLDYNRMMKEIEEKNKKSQ